VSRLAVERPPAGGAARSYEQLCPLACALDVVGDRWALLIVRELLFLGPRRFVALFERPPGTTIR
jgi:DNA-binding HxlR family transcriptional regulator